MWYHDGMICTGEVYKGHVKMTFPKGASLEDPSNLFNADLKGSAWRAIDIHEGDKVNEAARFGTCRVTQVPSSAR